MRKPSSVLLENDHEDKSKLNESKISLLVKFLQLNTQQTEISHMEQIVQQEKEMMEQLPDRNRLISVRELAKGITYTKPLLTRWKPPLRIRRKSKEECDSVRKKLHIIVDGVDIPPAIRNFKDMRFLEPVLRKLRAKGIVRPTPIQVQGLPVVLSGRDMIGISYTDSGKTFVFVLPMIMIALQEEIKTPIACGEGPVGLVVCPSREHTRQTFEVVEKFLEPMRKAGNLELRALLCIGGVDMRSQFEIVKKGVHIASKGLDFPDVKHVINFDMPVHIENYVHRIGQTGRCGKTGLATTFINKDQKETTLLDLKHLLQGAKQRIPPVLAKLNDPMQDVDMISNTSGVKGCAFGGGLGHRISVCPKL